VISRSTKDLPLARDASSRFLPWLIAFMVYLAAMALTAAMVLSGASANWRLGLSGTMTVQVIPLGNEEGPAALNARVDGVLKVLRKTPGITGAEVLSRDKLAALLEPWLGSGPLLDELPLPRLIDVRLAPGDEVHMQALESSLSANDPGTIIDDHGLWLDRLIALAAAIEIIALAVMVLICVSAVAAAVFTTHTGLAIHHDVIELLHLMGAQDDYIARQFQVHAFRLGLSGGLIGLALTVATLLVLGYLGQRIDTSLLPSLSLSILQWIALALIPGVAALIIMATARYTVIRTLMGMP
jgi:cell division transport system permease protein